ncbi:unnamed protein product [Arctogadus glacialis]
MLPVRFLGASEPGAVVSPCRPPTAAVLHGATVLHGTAVLHGATVLPGPLSCPGRCPARAAVLPGPLSVCERVRDAVTVRGSVCERVRDAVTVRGSVCERVRDAVTVRGSACERVRDAVTVRRSVCERVRDAVTVRRSVCERVRDAVTVRGSVCERVRDAVTVRGSVCERNVFPCLSGSQKFLTTGVNYRPNLLLLEKSARGRLLFALTASDRAVVLRYGGSGGPRLLSVSFRTAGRLALHRWTHLVLQLPGHGSPATPPRQREHMYTLRKNPAASEKERSRLNMSFTDLGKGMHEEW